MKKKGFTLIELLIVMAVIAILVAIAVPAFRGMRQEAQTTRAQGDLKVLKIAVESFYKSTGNYPIVAGYQDLLLGAQVRLLESKLDDPYVAGTNYVYVLSPDNRYYAIYSVGAGLNGVVVANNGGTVSVEAGSPIWVSNGYQP